MFAPLQDVDQLAQVPARTIALCVRVIDVFALFIYAPSTLYMDAWLRTQTACRRTYQGYAGGGSDKNRNTGKIGNDYYKPGTIEQTRRAYLEVVHELKRRSKNPQDDRSGFLALMAHNVDEYLDWYYSLPGEYERIVALATGKLESWMIDRS